MTIKNAEQLQMKLGHTGFSLIELMIVVLLIGTIAAIAIPSYREQVERGRRADGMAFLMDMASRQERFYTQYSSYTSVIVGVTNCSGSACGLNYPDPPGNFSSELLYTATIDVLPDDCSPGGSSPCVAYTLTATPQLSDPDCTTLTLDSTGVEGYTGAAVSVQDCWR